MRSESNRLTQLIFTAQRDFTTPKGRLRGHQLKEKSMDMLRDKCWQIEVDDRNDDRPGCRLAGRQDATGKEV